MFGPFYSGDSSTPFIMRAPFVYEEEESLTLHRWSQEGDYVFELFYWGA